MDRTLSVYTIQQNPKLVARNLRETFYPEFNSTPKEFLRSIIGKLAENNILVLSLLKLGIKKRKLISMDSSLIRML